MIRCNIDKNEEFLDIEFSGPYPELLGDLANLADQLYTTLIEEGLTPYEAAGALIASIVIGVEGARMKLEGGRS